jgi:FlaG/FlaF family flagellin (archaellin)
VTEYYRNNWLVQHTTTVSSGYYGTGGTQSDKRDLHESTGVDRGYLSTDAKNGPGMNLMFLYDATSDSFAMVGIGTSPSIDAKITGGDSADAGRSWSRVSTYQITLGSDYGGQMGKFSFGNATGGSGLNANRLCVTSSGWVAFWRAGNYNQCYGTIGFINTYNGPSSYTWSGFALGTSGYGAQAGPGSVTYTIGNVKPTPDTFAPEVDHNSLETSHSKNRRISAVISDNGDPASGLNVSTTAGVGPTMYHRVTDVNGSTGSWSSTVMTQQSGKSRADCSLESCTWSADVTGLDRGESVEYKITAQDISPIGVNSVDTSTSSTNTFSVGDPNKMFIVEWRDMAYTSNSASQMCTYQAVFYDVTNEIEFKYSDSCYNQYDAGTVGFMDSTKTKGQTLRHSTGTSFEGSNIHPYNYRFTTGSENGSAESFDRGLTELVNADATAITGSSLGRPYGAYCASAYWWTTSNSAGCADNIAMPEGFNFTYFGTDYNYTDSDGNATNDRINIGRHGNMHFSTNNNIVRTMDTARGDMPTIPTTDNEAPAGLIAPFWSYYGTYYCYKSTSVDCGVYTRLLPFEGKGTDQTSDITEDTVWDLKDSPIRINPSGDYLSVNAKLDIKPGVEIQIAAGKGISFDSTCDNFYANGTASEHINFTVDDNGGEWLGIAFTAACASTNDALGNARHNFEYVDFSETSDAAISAGSRHGSSPNSSQNVGNFSMSHVTFTNVGSAFSHGSGQGTVLNMMEFSVNGATGSCFDFAENADVVMIEGDISNCNTGVNNAVPSFIGGAIVNVLGSTSGRLHLENTTISNSYVNLISVDLLDVTVSNVTATIGTAQIGTAFGFVFIGIDSAVILFNFDADGYTTVDVYVTEFIHMEDVDFGTAGMMLYPGGVQSSATGPAGDNAVFKTVTAGDMILNDIQPGTFDDVTVGDLSMSGNPAASDAVVMNNLVADDVTLTDCGWNIIANNMDVMSVVSNGCSVASNSWVISDSTFGHSSSSAASDAFYARYSDVTIGESSFTTTSNQTLIAKADTNSDIRLIAVTQNGNDCSDINGSTGNCDVDLASSSAEIWYGGTATVRTYRIALISGVSTNVFKSGHTVSASVVDSSTSELFEVGTHVTDATGSTNVWVITGDESGNAYEDHNIRAFGPAGQNEIIVSDSWYPTGGFSIGSTIDLLLEPAPVDFDQAGMDCAWMDAYVDPDNGAQLPTNGTTANGQTIFEFDGTPMTLSADLNLDGCVIILKGSSLKVKSTATSSPVLTLSNGGKLVITTSPDTGAVGAISAFTSTYGLHLNIESGTLEVDGGAVRDVAEDVTAGGALLIGAGATLKMMNGGTIYGSSASSDSMATVKVDGGSMIIDDSSIINNGKTGTALWVQNSVGTINNIVVKNAAIGIQSYNGAPQVDGFTSTDNTVGVDVYGGMSLPTIYRSTLLSGEATGWKQHQIDLSGYLGSGDYLQVGWNSVFGGGNAHPIYTYGSTKYYMITDQYNINLEDNAGNSWNITSADHDGYYPYSASDPASGDGTHATYTTGATGGVPSWNCDYYGYHYGPNYGYQDWYGGYGSTGVNAYFTGSPAYYPSYYNKPVEFGFGWEATENTPDGTYADRYPYAFWGYSYTSYHGGTSGPFVPPQGYGTGASSSYNVCIDRTSSYYSNSGDSARKTMPTIDISASNLSKVTLYIDVLHNRADNYQDRMEFLARAGNNPADLGTYQRESGTPLFKDGVISGSDIGISAGGAYAAAAFQDIQVSNPTDAGMEITGQISSTVDGLEVVGGTYGVLVGNSASGTCDLDNIDLDGQSNAGVYYAKDMSGSLTGTVTNSAGAAYKFGPSTDKDRTFDSMTISSNAVGIDNAGTGDLEFTDVDMLNTKDFVISSTSKVTFVEGTVNTSSVEVTGVGEFSRMRLLEVGLTADGDDVEGATVTLIDSNGGAAGFGLTDANGTALGLRFVTETVDSSGLTTESLIGFKAMTVAKVDYYYNTSTDNLADFRYASQSVTLANVPGNTETIALTNQITERVCWSSTSSLYQTVSPCAGYISTSGSRSLSDGNGGQVNEYGYYGGLIVSQSNKVLMLDVPYLYLKASTTYDFNGTTILSSGAYDSYSSQRWYTRSPYGAEIYMNDAGVFGMAPNTDSEEMYGVEIGWYGSPITTFVANNTVFSNLAKIEMINGYRSTWSSYNWEIDDVSITNSTMTHFKGYSELNSVIQNTDMCMRIAGGDGGVISGNTFNNCGVGVELLTSTYSYNHPASSFGADNMTISGNTFNDGGEIADVWLYSAGNSDDVVISGNTINNANSNGNAAAIAVYSGNHKRLTISDNVINSIGDGITVTNGDDFEISGNTITGVGDVYAGIHTTGGYGDIHNNILVDIDGGLYVESPQSPPQPSTSLCSITNQYRYGPAVCTVTLTAGNTMNVQFETDRWGYEASIVILKPDGTSDSWGTYSFASNANYNPLVSYTDAGTYVLTLRDSYGDGGNKVYITESAAAIGVSGPMIADNSIITSPGRTAPNAVGLIYEDCAAGVSIDSVRNSVAVMDNAMFISDCDVSDVDSVLQGTASSVTVGINADDANGDTLTLSGTTVTGFETGVEKTSGLLHLTGDSSITGTDYAVYVDGASVTAINAAVNGGSTGTGLHVVNSDDVWVYPMDASGLVGMYVENSPFRWDGGLSTATTTLQVVESQGSIENMSWPTTTTQVDAGSNAYVTSIGNTIVASKLVVVASATIDEANLFSMDSTHLEAAPSKEVAMLIQSTDGTRASYVSTTFQPDVMVVDGDASDWTGGNALNPSGYAMPGMMSGDGTNDMLVTYIEGDKLYIGLTGEDFSNSDALIYLSVDGSGNSTGYNLGGAHTLPYQANYVLWIDDDANFALYSYGFLGWGPTSLSNTLVQVSSSDNLTEISIPFDRIGGTPDQVDIVAIVQGENSADVSTVHPTQSIDSSNTLQTFTEYMTVELTHGDLLDGDIDDEVLVYRSYKGSNTPSLAKNYDVMIKTEADCEYDWATSNDISLATNVEISLDMKRACPEIQVELDDITVAEDSESYVFSLLNMADDVQDLEADLSWTSTEGVLVAHDNVLVDWSQNGQLMTITPLENQFGTVEYTFEVTDSNGLVDSKLITFEVENVNDAPVICNVEDSGCMPIFSVDDGYENILAEGFGTHSKFLGDVSNASRSYIRDMANEQSPDRQLYSWGASVPEECIAFSVEVNALNELVITENTSNEKGGFCDITLTLADNGSVNTDATPYDVTFKVAPVNDALFIELLDTDSNALLKNVAGDKATYIGDYITMTEDDTNADNLTWSLLPLMNDIDHDVPADLTWTVEAVSTCDYSNYFTTEIVGTDLVFTLVPDATTTAPTWQIDYMNDNGIHQLRPNNQFFCSIEMVLKDTLSAPSHTPYYDNATMPIANYQQQMDSEIIRVQITNVPERVADYSFNADSGLSFNGVTNIMTGTYVPVTVNVDAGGDEGPYTYDHMLAVTFHMDGHGEDEMTKYYAVPDYGTSVAIHEDVYITKDTTSVEVTMDVLTCMNDPCDLTVPAADRFQADDPESHRTSTGGEWSMPGQYGTSLTQTSNRRPMLEDSNWCNNRLTTLEANDTSGWDACTHFITDDTSMNYGDFVRTGQALPNVVRTIGASAVPSFAPSLLVVSLTGLFVGALTFSSCRADDEEDVVAETLEDNDMAVSPVIATILMVAITVVLSGVIYVWASSLADTDVKGVPRVTFDMDDIDSFDADNGHWRITVQSAETDLATQAVEVRVFYVDASGTAQIVTYNMADTNGVYGFNPVNSDSMVTFVDQVNTEGENKVSTFNTGDTIFVRTHDSEGTPLEDVTITLSYAPNVGQGALLRTWSGLSYDLNA